METGFEGAIGTGATGEHPIVTVTPHISIPTQVARSDSLIIVSSSSSMLKQFPHASRPYLHESSAGVYLMIQRIRRPGFLAVQELDPRTTALRGLAIGIWSQSRRRPIKGERNDEQETAGHLSGTQITGRHRGLGMCGAGGAYGL